MAKLRFIDGGERNLKPDTALSIWQVLSGKAEPTEDQEKYIANISKFYLNWCTAPDDYVEQNFDIIVQLHFGDWMVHYCGSAVCPQKFLLTQPDPSRPDAIIFAEKWGLTQNGIVTRKAQEHLKKYQLGRWR